MTHFRLKQGLCAFKHTICYWTEHKTEVQIWLCKQTEMPVPEEVAAATGAESTRATLVHSVYDRDYCRLGDICSTR